MSMLNQAAVEALVSATYLENYLDCLDGLPDDMQRSLSELRELDSKYNALLTDIEIYKENYHKETDTNQKKKLLVPVQRALIKCQEIGDDKLQLVAQIIEHIENRSRQLEQDLENLDPTASKENDKEHVHDVAPPKVSVSKQQQQQEDKVVQQQPKVEKPGGKRQRRQRQHHDSIQKDDDKKDDKDKKKKKKRKMKKEDKGNSPIDTPIDPDEPLYCLCQQVSYGEMIGCDNDDCDIEWFHFNCVNLTTKPKGKWFCPQCRGDKPTVMRKDKKKTHHPEQSIRHDT